MTTPILFVFYVWAAFVLLFIGLGVVSVLLDVRARRAHLEWLRTIRAVANEVAP